jgi:hypothetical protein
MDGCLRNDCTMGVCRTRLAGRQEGPARRGRRVLVRRADLMIRGTDMLSYTMYWVGLI